MKSFSFWGLTNDLYKALDFVKECKGFEHVWLGNKGFVLEGDTPEHTSGNLEVLMVMLKKT